MCAVHYVASCLQWACSKGSSRSEEKCCIHTASSAWKTAAWKHQKVCICCSVFLQWFYKLDWVFWHHAL